MRHLISLLVLITACNRSLPLPLPVPEEDAAPGELDAGDLAVAAPDLAVPTPCERAAASRSSLGCEFWAASTSDSQTNPYFRFGVMAVNPADAPGAARVQVMRAGLLIAAQDIEPGASATMALDRLAALTGAMGAATSALVKDGAWHVTSTLPIALYQFSPLEQEKAPDGRCMPTNDRCHAYSADSSLLLPVATWGREHVVIARQGMTSTFQTVRNPMGTVSQLPGYFAVVATDDNTTVDVRLTAAARAGDGVAAEARGASPRYVLQAGAVLQLVTEAAAGPCANTASHMSSDGMGGMNTQVCCDLGSDHDFTGTTVSSDRPVMVIGGHDCSQVPYDRPACDHLEEQVPPTTAWGRQVVALPGPAWNNANEPTVFRVISAERGNSIGFDPPVHGTVLLDAGQWVELSTTGAFVATGTGKLAVAQYLVGAAYSERMLARQGDPSLSIAPPVEQLATGYDLVVPAAYTSSLLLATRAGATLLVDGKPAAMPGAPIGASDWRWQRIAVAPGVHRLAGDQPLSASVVGSNDYASYLHPAGTRVITVP